MLSSLSIGSYEFVSIPVNIAFAEAGALSWPEVMGILGNEILMRFNMFVDLQQKRIFLEPNQLYHEAFEVNCSGLELVMDDTFENLIVDYIYTDSPAEESGIKVGDEIIQIDGVSTADLQLPQIRSILSQDGQEVDILVSREGELYTYLLRLRPQISLQNRN
jgi:predicted metalloprotease with PDZ domain